METFINPIDNTRIVFNNGGIRIEWDYAKTLEMYCESRLMDTIAIDGLTNTVKAEAAAKSWLTEQF